jgi:hypothetical protein
VPERLERGEVNRLDVLPVHLRRAHPVRRGALRQVSDRLMLGLRRRFGPTIVLADEDDRDLPELGEVHRLVEGADVGRPVAEEGDRNVRLAPQLESERRADRGRKPAADDGVRAHVAALDVVKVHRAAIAVRAALELAVQLRHYFVRRGPVCEHMPMGAVRGGHEVALFERAADADRDCLLTDAGVQEAGEVTGTETLHNLLLEAPNEQHLAQEPEELLMRQASVSGHRSALATIRSTRSTRRQL